MAGASDTRVLTVRGASVPDGAAEPSVRESEEQEAAIRMTPTRAFVFAGDPPDFIVLNDDSALAMPWRALSGVGNCPTVIFSVIGAPIAIAIAVAQSTAIAVENGTQARRGREHAEHIEDVPSRRFA